MAFLFRSRSGRDVAAAGKAENFDLEAEKLFARLNLPNPSGVKSQYNALDPIWRHPKTGGTLYVGNVNAASNLSILKTHGITHVVNCTDSMPLYHQNTGEIEYCRFDIASWWRSVDNTTESVRRFTSPMFNFVGDALSKGKNVMVHCLAGAHRAGTTGCMCLVHFAGMNTPTAIAVAKRCRPVIDPIGTLPELIHKLEAAYKEDPPSNRFPPGHFA